MTEELTEVLTSATPAALSIRPPIGVRTASARSLPKSTHPRVTIILPGDHIPPELKDGLHELATNSARGNVAIVQAGKVPRGRGTAFVWVVGFRKDSSLKPGAMEISCNHDDFTDVPEDEDFEIEVSYRRPIEAFRGLGHILAISRGLSTFKHPDASDGDEDKMSQSDDGGGGVADVPGEETGIRWSGNVGAELRRQEQCLFDTVGVMIDCSRNGVMLASAVKFLLRQLALMGNNVLQLYTEETYKIKGEPFFGYFRGGYTQEELREIDDYAFALGIEVQGCIQALGHLGQMLQWPKYGAMRDTAEVLLAESDETYAFIEKMIQAIVGPLRSKRLHIGMDEAHGVSEGRFRQIYGYKDSTKVFTDHLHRVNDICKRNGVKPMIWSDMLFCLPVKNNALSAYYSDKSVVTEELSESIPDDVDLVFWSYYFSNSEPYSNKISQHWKLANKAPTMASGVWSWSRFWTALPFTFATVKANLKASKEASSGVRNIMTTIWGDEGNECDLYSCLPGMLYQCESAYTTAEEVDTALIRKKFDGITGGDFDDYVYASKLDDTQPESQPIDARMHYTPNIAKFLLWEEPFYSFLSPQYRGYDLEKHYQHVSAYLQQALSSDFSTMTTIGVPHSIEDFPANRRLQLPYLLAKILALKCHLRERLVHAYKTGDRDELEALGSRDELSRMSRLRKLVKELHSVHRSNWFSMYKPFGWEVLDLRYGGLIARLETMHQRLISYLDPYDKTVTEIPELDVDLEVVYEGQRLNLMLDYARASRPQYV